MTQQYAFDKARDLFGDGCTVGVGVIGKRTDVVHFVGKRIRAEWVILGTGDSFEEAFVNAKEVK